MVFEAISTREVTYTHPPTRKGFNVWGYPQTPTRGGIPPLDSPFKYFRAC